MFLEADSDYMKEFNLDKKRFLYENGFLYALCIDLSNNVSFGKYEALIGGAKKIGTNIIKLNIPNSIAKEKLYEVIEIIRNKKLSFEIYASGGYLNDLLLTCKKLLDYYPHRIIVPLYSMNEDVHDRTAGETGSCRKTVDFVNYASSETLLSVNISYIQTELNINSFEDVFEFTKITNTEISCDEEKFKDYNLTNLYNDDYLDENGNFRIKSRQKLFISENLELFCDIKHKTMISDLNKEPLQSAWERIQKGV